MKNPYIRLELFKNKRFMAVVVTSIFIYGIMMGTALWFPVYINRMTGAGMERAGYIMLPGAVIMAVSSVLGGLAVPEIWYKAFICDQYMLVYIGIYYEKCCSDMGNVFISFNRYRSNNDAYDCMGNERD